MILVPMLRYDYMVFSSSKTFTTWGRTAIKATVAEISRIQEKATLGKDQQEKIIDLIENAMKQGSLNVRR
jgi:hypothetical protein